jgi:hypothetical protein
MLDRGYVQKELDSFKKYVIQQSRSNLTKGGKNVNKKLYNSIDGEAISSKNSLRLSFEMEDYGTFQDLGVKGKDPSKVSKGSKIRGQQAPNSPYSFKDKAPPASALLPWVKARGISPRFRDAKGKFQKGSQLGFARLISLNIFYRGIKPSLFFTKPFEKAFERLPDDIIEAYGLDVESLIKLK